VFRLRRAPRPTALASWRSRGWMMGRLLTTMATKVSRQAQRLPLTAPSGPDCGGLVLAESCVGVQGDGELTVRIVMARMVPARMMNTAPLNNSINVSLRLSVVSTPHRSY
jgi:hypothetical protein